MDVNINEFATLNHPPLFNNAEMLFLFLPSLDDVDGITSDASEHRLRCLIERIDESRGLVTTYPNNSATSLYVYPAAADCSFRISHARGSGPEFSEKEFEQRVFFTAAPEGQRSVDLGRMRSHLRPHIMSVLPEIMGRRDEVWHMSIVCGLKRLMRVALDVPPLHKMIQPGCDLLIQEHHDLSNK